MPVTFEAPVIATKEILPLYSSSLDFKSSISK